MRTLLPLLLLSGCASYFEAGNQIAHNCKPTDLYAIQVQGLALQVWDCSDTTIEGSVVDTYQTR